MAARGVQKKGENREILQGTRSSVAHGVGDTEGGVADPAQRHGQGRGRRRRGARQVERPVGRLLCSLLAVPSTTTDSGPQTTVTLSRLPQA